MKDKQVSDVERCLKALNKEFEKLKAENNRLKAASNLKSSENVVKLTKERKSLLKKISELENSKFVRATKSKADELQNEVIRLKTSNREMQLKLNLLTKTHNWKSCEAMEIDDKEDAAEITKPKAPVEASKPKKIKKKCRFFERGTCRKGDECPFVHPVGVCVLFSHLGDGACPDGDACIKSHSTQICEQWVQGKCSRHNKCNLQHPQEPLKPNSRLPNQPRKGSDGGGYQNQRRGSQNREDLKPNFVQHQVYEQARPQLYSPPVQHQANLFQYPPPPPPHTTDINQSILLFYGKQPHFWIPDNLS